MTSTTDPATTDRSRPRWLLPVGVAGAVLLGIALWLTQPWLLFVDTVADEQLPLEVAADEAGDPAHVGPEDPAAPPGVAVASPSPDEPAAATVTEPSPDEPSSTPAPSPSDTAVTVLARGSFIGRDHTTSGDAAIVELADGSRVLTIEGLDTDNGPDLFVYLDDTAADGPESEWDDGVSLGRLRANQGDLVYEIPDDLDLTTLTSVGIWCDRFSSLFGAADLVPVA